MNVSSKTMRWVVTKRAVAYFSVGATFVLVGIILLSVAPTQQYDGAVDSPEEVRQALGQDRKQASIFNSGIALLTTGLLLLLGFGVTECISTHS